MKTKWDVVECDKNWRDEVSILQTDNLALNLFCDGTIPNFVSDNLKVDKDGRII
jgi:hypothetical protein